MSNNIVVPRDGEEALDYLRCRGEDLTRPRGNPGLVLLDLKLPRWNFDLDRNQANFCLWWYAAASGLDAEVHTTVALGIDEYILMPMNLQVFPDY